MCIRARDRQEIPMKNTYGCVSDIYIKLFAKIRLEFNTSISD